jgi:hypothetical protein
MPGVFLLSAVMLSVVVSYIAVNFILPHPISF